MKFLKWVFAEKNKKPQPEKTESVPKKSEWDILREAEKDAAKEIKNHPKYQITIKFKDGSEIVDKEIISTTYYLHTSRDYRTGELTHVFPFYTPGKQNVNDKVSGMIQNGFVELDNIKYNVDTVDKIEIKELK